MDDVSLQREILAIYERDESVHESIGPPELSSDSRLAEAHKESAARVLEIVQRHGWPDESIAGKDGAYAAWLLVYHLIDQPDFQRRMVTLLRQVAAEGRIEPWRIAMIEDRIRASEGRLQKYGTRLRWDEFGRIVPDPAIEDAVHVDEIRIEVGLSPLALAIARQYESAKGRARPTPEQVAERRRRFENLARDAGWRPKR